MSDRIPVYIFDPDHPHYGETGFLTGETISLFGKSMAKVELLGCSHGTSGCYVSAGQVRRDERKRA